MSEHPLQGVMDIALQRIKEMVDSNTIIGNPITMADGTMILPVSKVSFGFIAGGGEYAAEDSKSRSLAPESFPFAGGTGAGVSVQPVGFLVVGDGTVKMLPAQTNGAMERVVELLPQLLEDLSQNGEQSEKKKARKVYKTEIETFDFGVEEEGAKS